MDSFNLKFLKYRNQLKNLLKVQNFSVIEKSLKSQSKVMNKKVNEIERFSALSTGFKIFWIIAFLVNFGYFFDGFAISLKCRVSDTLSE